MKFNKWRDCKAWEDLGLSLSTTSNQACKLYDATVTQYVGWYDDDSVGGIEKCVENMIKEDPNFVMGHVLSNGLELMGTGTSVSLNPTLEGSVTNMVELASKTPQTKREALHVKAMKKLADGFMSDAAEIWEEILIEYPTDMLAIKLAHDAYFYMGYQPQMRDSIARVLPQWKPEMPLYGYLMGMHSFGLVETNMYQDAEKVAAKGLEINKEDPWSTHSMAHVLEMTGRQKEGISFMSSTVQDWSPCGMLACHNFWHWAIYHIEKGEFQAAFDIYDSEIGPSAKKSGAMLDIVDACSLLYRLEMEGQNCTSRWKDIHETCRPHSEDHILAFNDVHILMCLLGANEKESVNLMIESLFDYVRDGKGHNWKVTRDVGGQLMNAFVAYDEGNYNSCVDLMKPLRYDIVNIGGSNAQRDLFNLLLINAALRSPSKDHQKYARNLLAERKALKENAPMTDRLITKAMAIHNVDSDAEACVVS